MYFNIVLPIFLFLLNQSKSKACVVSQMIHPCFRKRSTIGQLNLQPATTEKEENVPCVT